MPKKRAASFWLNAMFFTMLQRVSLFLFGVAGYMILVRGFNTPTYGAWALFITLFSLFETVKQGLIRNATIRFLAMQEHHHNKNGVQSASLFFNSVFSILTIGLIFFCGQWIANWLNTPDLRLLLIVSSINILLLIPLNHCEILLQATFRFDSLFRFAFLRQCFFFAGVVVLFFIFPDYFTLINVLLVQVLGLLITVVYQLRKCKYLLLKRFEYHPKLNIEFFHFGKYTFGTNFFSGIARTFDHFITASALGSVQGKSYVAYYNTVARINNMVDVPSLAAADVLFPKNVEALENEGHEKVKYYFEQVTGTIVAFVVPLSLFIFFFPKLIIQIIAGPEYYPAIPILQLTILFSMVRPLSYQFGSTLDAIGRPDINFLANTFLMLLNFFLTYIFLHVFGGIGAAYATIIYYTVSLIVMMILLKKYINIDSANILQVAAGRYKMIWQFLTRSVQK